MLMRGDQPAAFSTAARSEMPFVTVLGLALKRVSAPETLSASICVSLNNNSTWSCSTGLRTRSIVSYTGRRADGALRFRPARIDACQPRKRAFLEDSHEARTRQPMVDRC